MISREYARIDHHGMYARPGTPFESETWVSPMDPDFSYPGTEDKIHKLSDSSSAKDFCMREVD